MSNKVMTASAYRDDRLSEFTLALLEDSGWYQVDYAFAEPLIWGKDRGCKFANDLCFANEETHTPDHFCNPSDQSKCVFDKKAVGFCAKTNKKPGHSVWEYFGQRSTWDRYADNCFTPYPYTNKFCDDLDQVSWSGVNSENFGKESACFEGSLYLAVKSDDPYYDAYCFKYEVFLQAQLDLTL